jgi:hypothetical protein
VALDSLVALLRVWTLAAGSDINYTPVVRRSNSEILLERVFEINNLQTGQLQCGIMTGRRKPKDPDPEHPEVITLVRLPFQEAQLLAGRLREEGVRAMVSDYEATIRVWEQTLFDVLIEARQADEARRIAARYLKA